MVIRFSVLEFSPKFYEIQNRLPAGPWARPGGLCYASSTVQELGRSRAGRNRRRRLDFSFFDRVRGSPCEKPDAEAEHGSNWNMQPKPKLAGFSTGSKSWFGVGLYQE